MSVKLIRVDKNGTKYYEDDRCPDCGGTGRIPYFAHIANGVCFRCGGTGVSITHWEERTPEYEQKLAERRMKRLQKEAAAKNAQLLEENNFNADGKTYVVVGNTYEIKDELKEAGAKFSYGLGWHFNTSDVNYPTIEISIEEVSFIAETGWIHFNEIADIEKVVKAKMPKESNPSEYVGVVGEKGIIEAKYTKAVSYQVESYNRYWGGTEWVYLYMFEDMFGNQFVWKTSTCPEIEKGKTYRITATISDHKEYKDVKQTYLKRCKFQEVA